MVRRAIAEDYLSHLAFAIKNLNLTVDAPIILSGYLAPYFTEEDIGYLLKRINSTSPSVAVSLKVSAYSPLLFCELPFSAR